MIKKSLIVIWNEIWLLIFKTPIYHPRFWEDERDKRTYIKGYGFFRKLNTMLSGFNSDKYILYQFNTNDKKLYLNDIRRRILSERISKKHFYIVHNKIVFEKYFQGVIPTAPKLAFIQRGKFQALKDENQILSKEDLIFVLKSGKELFLKPYDGGSGRGILRVSYSKGTFLVNKEPKVESELMHQIEKLNGYLVEEKFMQKGLSHDIYPDTLNTLRVFTLIDPENGKAFIAAAVHRFGTAKSVYADNWSQGGLSVYVDPETGVMGKGIQYPFDGKLKFVGKHPDTNNQFEGLKIKEWDKVRDVVLKGAEYVSFMPMLGWDVIISDGDIYILEANYNPDVNLLQVHKPLLENPRLKYFYLHHKVI
ncbi:Sugar-transfer associated ATP-grasp [Cyclonatronum proteinivorum]|uniref:Sugar-transfer associated ATP-grasp n=1 Tax=Cyclonatronum proteinivorum TaxID=1457365 RepID=A0A345UMI0_9BACT|nr:sugar-transfer associated ATP-grasp domain-containing protein [Cyclonatronum proteinivorum]AXJ01682.1 Sugar-transfer associated ATP-grasp [Cyclonatronum proteinivorum]